MVYGAGRIDASGRVADRAFTSALGWRPGDLGLTSLDWEDLRIAYLYGTYEPGPGTAEEEAFRRMDAYARSEAERVAALEEADEAWRAARAGPAQKPEPEREAGQ